MPTLRPPVRFRRSPAGAFVRGSGPEAGPAAGGAKAGISARAANPPTDISVHRRPLAIASGHPVRFDRPRTEAARTEDASACRGSTAAAGQNADAEKAHGTARRPAADES